MSSKLKDINELYFFKKTGLIEIAKYNSLFHGYWDLDKKDILHNFQELLNKDITIMIPDLDTKFYLKKYVTDFDFTDVKFKKDQPDYYENRKKHLIQLTKDRYKTDEEFRKKAIKRSYDYYHKLKNNQIPLANK